VTAVRVSLVDIYVLRPAAVDGWQVLALRRAPGGRSPGAWETVHGHLEPGESPVAGALRELREETGLEPARLYNASRLEAFYRHASDEVALAPVFAAVVEEGSSATLSDEHDRAEWLSPGEATGRFCWPRERRSLADVLELLAGGDAGLVEDVLLIPTSGRSSSGGPK